MKIAKTFSSLVFISFIFVYGSAWAGAHNENIIAKSSDNTITDLALQRVLTYQGILKNNLGNPVPDASYNIVFRIFSSFAGGTVLWASPITPVTTTGGFFTTSIGPVALPFDMTYYLSLQVGADPEMAQRQMLTMTPYSASADTANLAFTADTSIIARNVLDNSITSAKIVNGTILFTDIAQNGAISGQVMKWNGSAWVARNDSLGSGDITAVNTNEGLTGGGTSGDVTVGILNGGVTGAKIASNSIDSTKITNASIAFNDIGTNGASTGQVIKWNGSAWVARNDSLGSGNTGWVDGGTVVSLSSTGDSVGIGTSTPTAKLQVEGTLRVTDKANIGQLNLNGGTSAFVAGNQNTASGNYSTVGGGQINAAQGIHSTVSGGYGNSASNSYGSVGGGLSNNAANSYSAVAGGFENSGDGEYSSISGGYQNTSAGLVGAISGGQGNSTNAYADFVGGGAFNSTNGLTSAICGGQQNVVSNDHGAIGGGMADTVMGVFGGVASGYSNLAGDAATDTGAFVGGGYNNSATGVNSLVAGGFNNIASNIYDAVGGGDGNTASGTYSFVGGGYNNSATGVNSLVAGGYNNIASGGWATIGGGSSNAASGTRSAIGGGNANIASGPNSFVGGGGYNTASGNNSFVAGGAYNVAGGWGSFVGAGAYNVASANYSSIPGGDGNTAGGVYDLAFGNAVYLTSFYRVALFESAYSGRLGINRDDNDGGISYPIHVGTSTSNGNGAYLTNGGVWTNGSSRTFKENFTPFNGNELLSKISNLSVTTYNYKNSTEKHVGPVAEEFVGAFDTGVIRETDSKRDDMYLSSGDVAGVALAGVQELIRQNREMISMIEDLKAQVAELKKGK